MTVRQKAFCEYYLETGNSSEAARRAGYSAKVANRIGAENLTKPDIRAYIDERLAKADSKRIATADEVLAYLTSVMRGETKDEVVSIYDGITSRARKDVDARDKTKAAELLGKRYRLFVDRVEQQVDTEITIKLEGDAKDWAE
jgi:phage terminase small subunit